jgi:hypothetical protein
MKRAKINPALVCLLALPLAVAGLVYSFAAQAGAEERWENAGNEQRRAWGQDSQTALPAEKREKLHRLGPEELFLNGRERSARAGERNTAANKRENRKQRRKQQPGDDAEKLAPETPLAAPSSADLSLPEPTPALAAAAVTPPQTAAAAVAAAEVQDAPPPVAPAPRQPAWVLPSLAALFLLMLLALLLVLSKLASLWRSTGF